MYVNSNKIDKKCSTSTVHPWARNVVFLANVNFFFFKNHKLKLGTSVGHISYAHVIFVEHGHLEKIEDSR